MTPGTIVVILVLCGIIGLIISRIVKDHKKGKCSCGCDCSKCQGCNHS